MPASLPPPFLKKVWLKPEEVDRDAFPFARFRFLDDDFEMTFERPVTMFIGENGSEINNPQALAEVAGFHSGGGTVGFQLHNTSNEGRSALAAHCSRLAAEGLARVLLPFGYVWRSGALYRRRRQPCMHKIPLAAEPRRSFLALFTERFTFQRPCLYFLDEPENALSPMRQMALLRFMRQWEDAGNAQIVSPPTRRSDELSGRNSLVRRRGYPTHRLRGYRAREGHARLPRQSGPLSGNAFRGRRRRWLTISSTALNRLRRMSTAR